MLVLAVYPDEAFRAPLNTKNEAPVTKREMRGYSNIRPFKIGIWRIKVYRGMSRIKGVKVTRFQ